MSNDERERFDYAFWRAREDARVEAKYGVAFEAEMARLDARDARNNEKLSECDCCGRTRPGCIDTITGGNFPIDVHACPECLGNDPEDY
jgi:hypothetical protein